MPPTIVITTFLEAELVERIRQSPTAPRVHYDPSLIAPPRFGADHTGDPSFRRTPDQAARFRAMLAEADILYDVDRSIAAELPELAPKLRWIQFTSSGIGALVREKGLDRPGLTLTNAAGIHAVPLAEHTLAALLYFVKDFPARLEAQGRQYWARYCGRELRGETLGVIGMGAVGQEIARLAHAVGMRVLGMKRNVAGVPLPAGVERLFAPQQLHEMLPHCQHLVLIAPHTPDTEGLIGARELALLPAGAVLVNIARGALVDETALVAALEGGHLGGAALDVAVTEPLPADHPLWRTPRTLITPHSASTVAQENTRLTELFIDNLGRFAAGQPLRNLFRLEAP
jgi:glyoxylate/hydroxypyruvate reductase